MTYDEAVNAVDDPFEISYAWRHISKLDFDKETTLLLVNTATEAAVVISLSACNYLERLQRVRIPGELIWDPVRSLLSDAGRTSNDWHHGSFNDLTHWVKKGFQ